MNTSRIMILGGAAVAAIVAALLVRGLLGGGTSQVKAACKALWQGGGSLKWQRRPASAFAGTAAGRRCHFAEKGRRP